MPSKKHKPEEIIGKLREAEIALAAGRSSGQHTAQEKRADDCGDHEQS